MSSSSRAAGPTGPVYGDHGRLNHGHVDAEVDGLIKSLAFDSGVSKSTMSRICADIGGLENETRLTEFLRDLTNHGRCSVQLVIPRARRRLTAATWRILQGSPWQRCCAHAIREHLPSPATSIVTLATLIGTVNAKRKTTEHANSSTKSSDSTKRFPPPPVALPSLGHSQ